MKTERKRHRFFLIFLFFTGISTICFSQPPELYINEFQATTDSLVNNPYTGGYSDWIEIYNAGSADINMKGFFLTDDPQLPNKWQIFSEIVIASDGYALFWADDINDFINIVYPFDTFYFSNSNLGSI